MAKVKDILSYVCEVYPPEHGLSLTRVMRILYLADWRSSLKRGAQLSDLEWVFGPYGPIAEGVWTTIEQDPDFEVESTRNEQGKGKQVLKCKSGSASGLAEEDREIVQYVLDLMNTGWSESTQLVYSTFPILMTDRQGTMNLAELARQYEEGKNELSNSTR